MLAITCNSTVCRSRSYIRKKVDYPLGVELKTKKFPFPLPNCDSRRGYTRAGELPSYMRFYVIGLAGKIYPLFELVWDYAESVEIAGHYTYQVSSFCYTLEDVIKAIKSRCNKKAQEKFNETERRRHGRYFHRYTMSMRREEFEFFFEEWHRENQSAKVQPLFMRYPLWAIEHREGHWYVCYNCSLKDYKFFKVKDPVTTYQEVAMFMGGLAAPQKPIPVPSDKDMVSIKGFDKHSFRKEPTKKKRR